MFTHDANVDPDELRQNRSGDAVNYRLNRNRANRYLQDREEMKTETFLGVGRNFAVHDTMATESEGDVYDRTQEHLGYTDRGIIHLRKIMAAAVKDVQEGKDPIHVIRDQAQNEFPDMVARDQVIQTSGGWQGFWRDRATREMAAPVR